MYSSNYTQSGARAPSVELELDGVAEGSPRFNFVPRYLVFILEEVGCAMP